MGVNHSFTFNTQYSLIKYCVTRQQNLNGNIKNVYRLIHLNIVTVNLILTTLTTDK